MSFQIHALAPGQFESLFAMSDRELAKIRAQRMTVDSKPGYPCRVSLVDAEIGETVILVNYQHLAADTPYRSAHAVFARQHAKQAFPAVDAVPDLFAGSTISVRAFDNGDYMVDAAITPGSQLAATITAMFLDTRVDYLHLHNAQRGCFMASVARAG